MKKSVRLSGQIATWKDDRGFGFITPSDGTGEVFVHISAFVNRHRRPTGNEAVSYLVKQDAQGRIQASRVWFTEDQTTRSTASTRPIARALAFVGLFLGAVASLVVVGKLPPAIFGLYFGASTVAIIRYAWDKSAARKGRWRTSEMSLHLLGLSGGWPGALVARHVFRHKSKKQSFIIAFWVTVALNCIALIWFLTPSGARILESMINLAWTQIKSVATGLFVG